jgi:hypothetical protein
LQALEALLGIKVQNKTIHIVFQILNFLSNPILSAVYELSSDEKLLLLFLSKHKGVKGIYPSVLTLAKELQRSDSAIRRSLRRLQSKNLIKILHIPGKSSLYQLFIPSVDLSTTLGVDASTEQNLDDQPLASTLGQSMRGRQDTPSVDARQSIKRNNTKLNKTERSARKKAALPLSDDFEPTRETVQEAKRVGLTYDEANYELEKFFNYYLENEEEKTDWQLVLQNWFIRAGDYKRKNGAITVNAQEVRSTVPWFNPERDAPRDSQPVNSFMDQVRERLSTQGGKPNGIGHGKEGEIPKD